MNASRKDNIFMKTKFINNKLRLIFNEYPEHLFCKHVLGLNENTAVFARIDRVEEVDEDGRTIIHPVIDIYRYKNKKQYDTDGCEPDENYVEPREKERFEPRYDPKDI